MKNILLIILLFITTNSFSKSTMKDSIFLPGDKTYPIIKGSIKKIGIENSDRGTLVNLYDQRGVIDSQYTNDGTFSFEVRCNTKYSIKAHNLYFIFDKLEIDNACKYEDKILNVVLIARKNPRFNINICYKQASLAPILFNYKDTTLTCENKVQLLRFKNTLTRFPKHNILLSTHTDSRGSKEENLKLSKKRAKVVKNFLISEGIIPERIIAKGYGESRLTNKCSDGIICSEIQHSVNNRVTFRYITTNKK